MGHGGTVPKEEEREQGQKTTQRGEQRTSEDTSRYRGQGAPSQLAKRLSGIKPLVSWWITLAAISPTAPSKTHDC
jgi:hypothetical protein